MYIIGNWKQNKKISDVEEWVNIFAQKMGTFNPALEGVVVVIAPPYPLIHKLKDSLNKATSVTNIFIGSQNLSEFSSGSHTGEVGVEQIGDAIKYSIIGHSERRRNGETSDQINKKIGTAMENGITSVVCFSNEDEFRALNESYLHDKKVLFAYEPSNAISTAENSSGPADIEQVESICKTLGLQKVIYGGSVNKETMSGYVNSSYINGFLIGAASLDADEFSDIIRRVILEM